jgi:hypothetical protein
MLWWTAGVSSVLAQIPLLGRVGAVPGLARIRSGLTGSATAVATVTALVVAGVVGGGSGGQDAVSRRKGVQSAAPVAPPATAPTPTPALPEAAREAAAPAGTLTTTTVLRSRRPARSVPTFDELLSGVATTVTTGPPSGAPAASTPAPPAPAGGPAAPAPPAPAPPPFSARGQLLAPDLLGRLGIGLTNRGPSGGCGPSVSQGLDAWVFELPAEGGPAAGAPVKATGSDLLGLHNLAVTFLSGNCVVLGQLDTPEPDESGVLPAGSRFVVVSDRSGVGTAVTLTVG